MADLFTIQMSLNLPERVAVFGRVSNNVVRRLASPRRTLSASVTEISSKRARFYRCECTDGQSFAIIDRDTAATLDCDAVLRIADISSLEAIQRELSAGRGKWIYPRPRKPGSVPADEASKETGGDCSRLARRLHSVIAEERDGDASLGPDCARRRSAQSI